MIRRGRAVTVLMAAFLGGCPPPWHAHDTVEVLVQGGQPLNPDEAGESRPLKVRLYQLKDDARFLSASPMDLALNDEGILEQQLLIRREITILPGQPNPGPAQVSLGERVPGLKFIGVLAQYPGRRADGETWHAVVEADDTPSIVVRFRARTLTLGGR